MSLKMMKRKHFSSWRLENRFKKKKIKCNNLFGLFLQYEYSFSHKGLSSYEKFTNRFLMVTSSFYTYFHPIKAESSDQISKGKYIVYEFCLKFA